MVKYTDREILTLPWKRRRAMRIDVLGVGFDNVTKEEAVDRGMAMLDAAGAH